MRNIQAQGLSTKRICKGKEYREEDLSGAQTVVQS